MNGAFKDWHLHIKLFLAFFLFTNLQIILGKGFHNQFGKSSCSSQIDSVSCTDLKGVGSLNNTCLIRSGLNLSNDICIYGNGNIEVFHHVSIICPINGCSITINVSGSVKIGAYAQVVAGSIIIDAANVTLNQCSALNTTSLGGPPPSQTSGTPSGVDGAGGGHGGRGASCLKSNKTNWGGDVYAWATLADPWSYGSKGGSMSVQSKYSGDGGGRVMVNVKDSLVVDGYIGADGGESTQKGGGGSGGSIIVRALKLKGNGTISAAGGRGWGGGGGGRISLECYSIQGVRITVHGGQSIGCPENSGAAGTYYDKTLKSLRVSNDNFTTHTETPLLDFPTMTLWANVFVENYAKALVPLLWSRVQVRGQIRLLDGGSICFGLADYPVSEFELVAEELLMSDSVIKTGPGSLLQAPLDEERGSSLVTKARCESQSCPKELIMPPDDCHVNNSLSYTLQICRVEDISVNGQVKGSIIHVHRARTVSIGVDGVISASELGCKEGIGKGKILKYGAGGGAGHGGKGGSGFYNGMLAEGGQEYGDPDLPCELGSGGVGPSGSTESAAGGGMIVMGSIKWPISRLEILGSLEANGQSHKDSTISHNKTVRGGFGGGSGGTVLLFLQTLHLGKNSSLSVTGGHGSSVGGGGGGGGRVHFDWSNIATGDEYIQIASISGSIISSGGTGDSGGHNGGDGTVNGKKCPKGLYGTFCNECPVGTYKDVTGSNASLCTACSLHLLPQRAEFIYVRGGATGPLCPYRCRSEKYRMPQCNTPYEDLIYIFGGPWPFAFLLLFVLVLVAMLLSAIRIKMLRTDYVYRTTNSIQHGSSNPSPYLLSLAEVPGASRAEESQSHVHRMYFMGPNTFREPWHLPYSPPDAIIEIVYEDAFNRFIDEINSVSAYEWWEGSIHSILAVLAYPCTWSWKQWRRRKKIHRLQQYVKSEYDHSCLRSCRSRALYQGMKVGSTPDLMVAYIDFFLGGDEKRLDIATAVQQRFPMCIIFGGNGSFMSPYCLHIDPLLSNLLGQHMSTAIWNRLVSGLNAQLRTVRQGCIHKSLFPVISWINSHGNPQLEHHGFKVDLGWFQATASGYYQLGIVLGVTEHFRNRNQSNNVDIPYFERGRKNISSALKSFKQPVLPYTSNTGLHKRITGGVSGGIITESTLKSLAFKRDYLFPFSLLLQNTRPFGLEDTLQLLICVLVLGDFTITLLLLFQLFWESLAVFLVVLLVLPLSLLPPFPAGLNALFSHGPKRSSVARIYALWNVTSMSNIIMSLICGIVYYEYFSSRVEPRPNSLSLRREDGGWWVLPMILLLVKTLQARFINWHIANLEIMDPSLYSSNPEKFWEM